MGLDWNPIGRAKPGFEAELETLLTALAAPDQETGLWQKVKRALHIQTRDHTEQWAARVVEITIPVYEDLGAPRVGSDPDADAWIIAHVREENPEADEAEILDEHDGYYVLALLPESPGFPLYTSWGYKGVDRYTFRAKFLDSLETVLGTTLIHAGYGIMTPAELVQHGEALMEKATEWAERLGRPELLTQRDISDAEIDTEAGNCHVTAAAGKWCLYWGKRGHGLEPYF